MTTYDEDQLKQIQQYRAISEKVPCSKNSLLVVEPIIGLPKPVLDELIIELDPTQTPSNGHENKARQAAQDVLNEIAQEHKTVAEQRLKRIAEQDEVTPFEAVPTTEVAFGFSNETLTNACLVNPGGVGTALGALYGMLEEMGLDPERVVPDGMVEGPIATADGEPLAPSGKQTLEDYFEHGPLSDDEADSDRIVEPADRVSRHDLMENHNPVTESLKHQLKYFRDCYFLRELYDPITSLLDDPNCPQIVWKEAAIDIKNDEDPLSIRTDSEDAEIPTDKLLSQANLPPHLEENNSNTNTPNPDAQQNKQTGLDQFR